MVPATNIFMTNSLAACPPTQALGLLVFERCPWRVPEADGDPVIGIHQADRTRGLECWIRHTGLWHAKVASLKMKLKSMRWILTRSAMGGSALVRGTQSN